MSPTIKARLKENVLDVLRARPVNEQGQRSVSSDDGLDDVMRVFYDWRSARHVLTSMYHGDGTITIERKRSRVTITLI